MNSNDYAVRKRVPAASRVTFILSLVILGVFAASAEPVQTQNVHEQFVGVYTLAKYSGHGDKPTGRISYDASGRMWVMLLPPDRKPLTKKSLPQEYKDTMRSVVAYYGTYHIDEATGRVIHHVLEASNPAWKGANFIRWYRFKGPDLYISLKPDFSDPLLWKRLPENNDYYRLDEEVIDPSVSLNTP